MLVDKLRKKRASGNEDTELKAADLEPLDDIPNVDGSLVRHMQAMISLNLIISRHNSGLFGPGGYIRYRIARIEARCNLACGQGGCSWDGLPLVLRYTLSSLGKRVCQIMPLISMILTDK